MHVLHAEITATVTASPSTLPLALALHSPHAFGKLIQNLPAEPGRWQADIRLRHAGVVHIFRGDLATCGLREFAARVKSRSMLWQKQLSLDGPQGCCH
jgi:hypothetical protein